MMHTHGNACIVDLNEQRIIITNRQDIGLVIKMSVRKEVEHIILERHTGNGTIYLGQYYHLDYQPLRGGDETQFRGAQLVTRRNDTENAHEFMIIEIPFKPGLFGSKEPFEVRLKSAIDRQVESIRVRESNVTPRVVERPAIEETYQYNPARSPDENRQIEEAYAIRAHQVELDNLVARITGKSVEQLKTGSPTMARVTRGG
jgi:hypothetical protein